MSGTKRTPIRRPPRGRFTPLALATFEKMQKLESRCTCKPKDEDECPACAEWWTLNNTVLKHELRLQPWDIAVESPNETDGPGVPLPSDPEARARYHALAAALAESKT